MNPIVTGLTEYVEANQEQLIAKAILKGDTAGMVTLMSQVVGPTRLNLLSTDVQLQAAACEFTNQDAIDLSERILTPAYLAIYINFCDKDLVGKALEHKVQIAAGKTEMPFEQKFAESIAESIAKQIEIEMWAGDADNGANHFDGYIKLLTGTGIKDGGAQTDAYSALKAAYMALPEESLADDTVLFISPAGYRSFIDTLTEKNLYHFDPELGQDMHYFPGTSVKVKKTVGLTGKNEVYGGRLSNMFYGTNLEGDATSLDIWYSKDERVWKVAAEFTAGAQVAFPEQMSKASF